MMDRRTALGTGALGLAAAALDHRSAQAQAPAAPAAAPPAAPAAAPALPYRAHSVRTPDGLQIAAYEYGNPTGPAILLVHGYQQCAMSWDRQTRDAELAARKR